MKQSLKQKLLQKLSPQQIQLMKLLKVPTALLDQRIKDEIIENPALEEGNEDNNEEDVNNEYDEINNEYDDNQNDNFDDIDKYFNDDDDYNYKLNTNNNNKNEIDYDMPISNKISFIDKLTDQISMIISDEDDFLIAENIIGNLDENGYLRREIEDISDDIAFNFSKIINIKEIERILQIIQRLDPPGIGARDLQECLLIQINRLINESKNDEKIDELKLSKKIIEKYFDAFTKKHYSKLKLGLKLNDNDDDKLKNILDNITNLNPKPAEDSQQGLINSNMYIIPDFYLDETNPDKLFIMLNNRNTPELKVSNYYRKMLENYKTNKKTKSEKDTLIFIKNKIDSANWFIEAINQRFDTMQRTMEAILEYQYEFFRSGDEQYLKPMILKNIADKIEMDISTISRVTNTKYIQTSFGTYSLKFFFSESLTNERGNDVSTTEVKYIMKKIIDNEDKRKPLTDDFLVNELHKKGYNVARRTIAKYRDQLDIPVARLRKEF